MKRLLTLGLLVLTLAGYGETVQVKPAVIYYDAQGKVSRQEIDTTGDGRTNLWVYYEHGQMVREEEDTVGDGMPHVWSYFKDGKLERQEVHTKGQARPDIWYHVDAEGQLTKKGMDTTGTGKPDVIAYYEEGKVARSEQDLNDDGTSDRFLFFDRGVLSRLKESSHRDGRIDLWITFNDRGEKVKEERDSGGGGRPDTAAFYEAGKLVRLEEDPKGAGRPSRWSYFENGELVRREEDRNGDGKPDLWVYFEQGQRVKQEEDPEFTGRPTVVYQFRDGHLVKAGESTSGDGDTRHPVFRDYFRIIEKRVRAAWKLPESSKATTQTVKLGFSLRLDGSLQDIRVVSSMSGTLNVSALAAMKRASPFPPLPAKLHALAGQPLVMTFTVRQAGSVMVPKDFSQKHQSPIILAVAGFHPLAELGLYESWAGYLGRALENSPNISRIGAEVVRFAWSGDTRDTDSAVAALRRTYIPALLARARQEKKPLVIVTHSWGGILAYRALHELQEQGELNKGDVEQFVTLGVPLNAQ